MHPGIGIDFGTSNSIAAIFDGERLELVALDGQGPVMPSATYIDRNLQACVGQSAIDQYIAGNRGRKVELTPEVIGVESEFAGQRDPENPAPIQATKKRIYGRPILDSGLRGRLFRGVKRLLGNDQARRLLVFDHPFRLVALITPILAHIHRRIAASVEDFSGAHVGHPVHFEGHQPQCDQSALARLGEACRYGGIRDLRTYAEPVAATVHHLHSQRDQGGELLLTVDFGGGTLDLCVLRLVNSRSRTQRTAALRFEVVATHGVAMGGDHIDQLLFRALLFPLLGQGDVWRQRGMSRDIETRFPFADYEELLLNWTIGYLLNQNRYTAAVMDRIAQGGVGRQKFARLLELIQRNLGYIAVQAIKRMKADLSQAQETVLDIPELDVRMGLTRPEFEALIDQPLATFAATVDETLNLAEAKASDIDLVLRTGGSNLIPAVQRILEERFPGRIVEQDPCTSVAAGLAVCDFHCRN